VRTKLDMVGVEAECPAAVRVRAGAPVAKEDLACELGCVRAVAFGRGHRGAPGFAALDRALVIGRDDDRLGFPRHALDDLGIDLDEPVSGRKRAPAAVGALVVKKYPSDSPDFPAVWRGAAPGYRPSGRQLSEERLRDDAAVPRIPVPMSGGLSGGL
jgi:hypothetical protein